MQSPWKQEISATLRLAVPVALGQVGMVALSTVDLAMVGRVSETALAAVALANLYTFALMMFGMGVLHALDPLLSQAIGADRRGDLGAHVQRGLFLATAMTVPAVALTLPASAVLRWLGQPESVIPEATRCVHAIAPGIFPFLVFVVLRQTLQAQSRTRAIVVTVVAANAVNAALNWVLVWGNLGAPALGAVGCAWATSVCRAAMALGLLGFGWAELRSLLRPRIARAWRPRQLWPLLRLGAPIGLAHLLEYGAFMTVMLWMGNLGQTEVAAHQVAINLSALTFMASVGISSAAAVRVGYAVGAGDLPRARRAAVASLAATTLFMGCFAVLMLTMSTAWAQAYTDQVQVALIAAALIQLAGVFQVFDGIQVVAAGVLRGLADTRTAMLAQTVGLWLVGLPIGYWLGFGRGLGPTGLWWGLVAGLGVAALVLLVQVARRLRPDRV